MFESETKTNVVRQLLIRKKLIQMSYGEDCILHRFWIPAFAGMTTYLAKRAQGQPPTTPRPSTREGNPQPRLAQAPKPRKG